MDCVWAATGASAPPANVLSWGGSGGLSCRGRGAVLRSARGLVSVCGCATGGCLGRSSAGAGAPVRPRSPASPWSKMVAAAITPTSDALIVLTNGGKLSRALGVHGLTAGLLVAAGLILALG